MVELSVRQLCGGDVVLGEWRLSGVNPACGAGTDMSNDQWDSYSDDVDGHMRLAPWDIGADQVTSGEASIGFAAGPTTWWESEGHALLQVILPAAEQLPDLGRLSDRRRVRCCW